MNKRIKLKITKRYETYRRWNDLDNHISPTYFPDLRRFVNEETYQIGTPIIVSLHRKKSIFKEKKQTCFAFFSEYCRPTNKIVKDNIATLYVYPSYNEMKKNYKTA